jgi:hypothetical protein
VVCCRHANAGVHILLALVRSQRLHDAPFVPGMDSSNVFDEAKVLEAAMQAPGVSQSIPRGPAFDAAALAALRDTGTELRRTGDTRELAWALLRLAALRHADGAAEVADGTTAR